MVKKEIETEPGLTKIVFFLSIIGTLISTVTVWLQFSTSGIDLCTGCSEVIQNKYSLFMGIPVSLISLIGFICFAGISFCFLNGYNWSKIQKELTRKKAGMTLLAIAVIGIVLSGYYYYIQKYVLVKWCLFCIILSILVVLIFLILLYRQLKIQKKENMIDMK